MSLGSILLGLALLLVVALVVSRPLFQQRQSRQHQGQPQPELLTRKEGLLAQIRALDFDFETGKLPAEEYQALRQTLVNQAADTLRQLDAVAAISNRAAPDPAAFQREMDLDAAIEAAVARRRRALRGEGAAAGGQPLRSGPIQ